MKGLCVSKGSISGTALIVDNTFSTKQEISPGTILVMKTLDRQLLVNLNKNVVGVVAELGNIGSHGAGILRSMRIPCILRIKNAVSSIKNGQQIDIIGERGEVYWYDKGINITTDADDTQCGSVYWSMTSEEFSVDDIRVNNDWYCPRPDRAYQKLRFDIIAPVFGKSGCYLFGLPEAKVIQNDFGAVVVKGAPNNNDICRFVLRNPDWLVMKAHERDLVIKEIKRKLSAIEIIDNNLDIEYYLKIVKTGIELYRQLFLYSLMSQAISDEILDAYIDFEGMITGSDVSRDVLGLRSIYVNNCIESGIDPGVSQRWKTENAYPHIWEGEISYDILKVNSSIIQKINSFPNAKRLIEDYEAFRIIVPLVYQLSEEFFYTSSSINSYINWSLLHIYNCMDLTGIEKPEDIYNYTLEQLFALKEVKNDE